MAEISEAELDKLLLGEEKPISEQDLDRLLLSGDGSDGIFTPDVPASELLAYGLKEGGKAIAEKALDAADFVGKVLDYPMAPVREGIGTAIEAATGPKTIGDVGNAILTPLVEGPSKARSWAQIFQDLGVPSEGGPTVPLGVESLMTDQEIEMSPKFQTAQVAGAMADLAQPAAMAKVPKIPNIINRAKQTERAIGLSQSAIEKGLQAPAKSTSNVKNITDFAKESGIVKPFSSTETIMNRASKKAQEAGEKIGKLVSNANTQIENWVSKAPPKEVEAYLNSGFNVDKVGAKMAKELADELEGGSNVKAALRSMQEWVERHDVPLKGRPDLETLQKWKKNVGNSIKDFSKSSSKQPGKEAAYKKILEYIDLGIESEIKFAEKYLKGKDLSEFKELKRDYSLSSKIEDSARKKFASERSSGSNASNLKDILLEPIYGSRTQSTLATLPERVIPRGPMANQSRIILNQPTPYELQEQINSNPNMTPTEKARALREIQR